MSAAWTKRKVTIYPKAMSETKSARKSDYDQFSMQTWLSARYAEVAASSAARQTASRRYRGATADLERPAPFRPIPSRERRTVTAGLKYADFHQITRSQTVISPPASQGEIEAICFALIDQVFPIAKGIRLLGVTLSSLVVSADFGAGQLRLAL